MKAIDYLCIIVHWKNALPWRLVYNFGCLSLKIVKLAFHWRWIFVFVSGWHVAANLMALLRSSSAWSLRHYWSNITQKYGFFSFPGWPEKCSLKKGKKREYMLHCVFQELILIVAIPEITPETRILICLQITRRSGRSATLAKSKFISNQNYRPIGGVGSLWLSSSF